MTERNQSSFTIIDVIREHRDSESFFNPKQLAEEYGFAATSILKELKNLSYQDALEVHPNEEGSLLYKVKKDALIIGGNQTPQSEPNPAELKKNDQKKIIPNRVNGNYRLSEV